MSSSSSSFNSLPRTSSTGLEHLTPPRTGSPSPRTPSPSPFGHTASTEIDHSNLKTIQSAYRIRRSSASPSSSNSTALKLRVSEEGKLYFATGEHTPETLKTIQELINKVYYPLVYPSDPIARSQALHYLQKLQRWLPLILGPVDIKKVDFVALQKSPTISPVAATLTGNRYVHFAHANNRYLELTSKREAFEIENPDFYGRLEQSQIRLIKEESVNANAQLTQLNQEIQSLSEEMGTIEQEISVQIHLIAAELQASLVIHEPSTLDVAAETQSPGERLEELEQRLEVLRAEIQAKQANKSYLEVQKIPTLNKILNYYYFLHTRITLQSLQFSPECALVQDLYAELDAFNSQLTRPTQPMGSGLNAPVTNYAFSIFDKEDSEKTCSATQILGVAFQGFPAPKTSPLTLEKPAIDYDFQFVGNDDLEGSWAGHHEVVAYAVDQELFQGAFQIAPVVLNPNPFLKPDTALCTEHAYVKNKGTALDFETNPDVELRLDPENVLWMVIALAVTKNPDLHKGNFLVKKHTEHEGRHQLIPVDFGRMLLASPLSHEGACRVSVFIEWLSTIEQQYGPDALFFTEEQKKIICNIRPEMIKVTVKNAIGFESLNPAGQLTWNKKILHMKANVMLLQMAIERNLSAKEVLVLLSPALGMDLTPNKQKELDTLVRNLQDRRADEAFWLVHGGMYEADAQMKFKTAIGVGANPYFDRAWSICEKKVQEGSIKTDSEFENALKQSLSQTLHSLEMDVEGIFGNPKLINTLKTFSL